MMVMTRCFLFFTDKASLYMTGKQSDGLFSFIFSLDDIVFLFLPMSVVCISFSICYSPPFLSFFSPSSRIIEQANGHVYERIRIRWLIPREMSI